MLVTRTSQMSGIVKTIDIDVDPEIFADWETGHKNNTAPLIQDVFPNLTDDDREFILTGITPDEWKKLDM